MTKQKFTIGDFKEQTPSNHICSMLIQMGKNWDLVDHAPPIWKLSSNILIPRKTTNKTAWKISIIMNRKTFILEIMMMVIINSIIIVPRVVTLIIKHKREGRRDTTASSNQHCSDRRGAMMRTLHNTQMVWMTRSK